MPCVIHVTDIHGNLQFCERIFEVARMKKISGILISGDLAPPFNREGQRIFLEQYLIRRIEDFFEDTGIPVFAIMGNDDFSVNADLLEKADRKGFLHYMDRRKKTFGGFDIYGYPFVNPTPFLLKDWEKQEHQISEDLDDLVEGRISENTIFMFHAPPYNTTLDILHYGEHCGSMAVREFIERHQPYLTLHGHVHESPEKSGVISDKIGKTISINPGPMKIVLINLNNLNRNIID
jgi:Icc-related predicted phosphoesterase